MDVSYSELSRLTGKSYRTIKARLESAGLKPLQAGDQGKAHLWDSAAALEMIYSPATVDGDGALDLNAERARLASEQADKVELENAKRRGELLEAAELGREFESLLVSFKTMITGLPSKLSALTDEPDERRRLFIESKALTDQALKDLAAGLQRAVEK